jgi:hypothetical protein
MARNPRREANLKRIAKKQRAAGQKVSKNERQGVPVKSSGFDPRRPMAEVRAMSGRELRSYERHLDAFVSRRTQFTALNFGGSAVPRSHWRTYQRLEARNNRIAQAREAAIANIKLPGQDMTIGQRLGIGPNRENIPQANASYRVFQQIQRDPRFITGPKKLDRLIDQMKEKIRPGYLDKAIKPKLNSLNAVLKGSDNADFIERVAALNAEQQNLLIDYSTFISIAEDRFSSGTAQSEEQARMDRDYEMRHGISREQDIHDQLERVLQWVVNEVYPASRNEPVPYVERTPAGSTPVQRGRGAPGRAGREFTDTNAGPIETQGGVERTPAGPIPIQTDRFAGHRVGDFIMSERSGSVWQVEARNRAAGTIRVRNIENGRAREVKPSNYIGITEHNRRATE